MMGAVFNGPVGQAQVNEPGAVGFQYQTSEPVGKGDKSQLLAALQRVGVSKDVLRSFEEELDERPVEDGGELSSLERRGAREWVKGATDRLMVGAAASASGGVVAQLLMQFLGMQ